MGAYYFDDYTTRSSEYTKQYLVTRRKNQSRTFIVGIIKEERKNNEKFLMINFIHSFVHDPHTTISNEGAFLQVYPINLKKYTNLLHLPLLITSIG